MSLKGTKNVAVNRYELEITVDKDKFAEALDKAYKENVKKISLPGFRKGKAPKHMIEKMYGDNFFFEDALNILYAPCVEEAIKESGLEYVDDKIDFDLVSISREEGVDFKVVITVKPEVTIEGYKGLKAEKAEVKVSDDEVTAEINKLADRNSRLVSVEDRAAQNGDIAIIDYEGFVDGKAFKGGKGESHSLTLGSGEFIPGFEEQVVGHNVGDEFDVNVEFPKEYHAEELAGKPAAAVVSCRRGGASAAFERLNMYFSNCSMPIVTSQYWNQVHGFTPEDVRRDAEGLQTMRTLAQNMAWMIKNLGGSEKPVYEEHLWTHFIMPE